MLGLGYARLWPCRWLFATVSQLPRQSPSRRCSDIKRNASRIICKTCPDKTCNQLEAASYQPGCNSVAFVTTPDPETARKLARSIIERRLAACVNVVPKIESIYLWEGKVNEDREYLLMIKTRTERVDELSKFVRENHPYSVAEVISLPIQNGNLPYLNWIKQTVPATGSKNYFKDYMYRLIRLLL